MQMVDALSSLNTVVDYHTVAFLESLRRSHLEEGAILPPASPPSWQSVQLWHTLLLLQGRAWSNSARNSSKRLGRLAVRPTAAVEGLGLTAHSIYSRRSPTPSATTYLFGYKEKVTEEIPVGGFGLFQHRNWLSRNDQEMHRRLGVDVPECDALLGQKRTYEASIFSSLRRLRERWLVKVCFRSEPEPPLRETRRNEHR